MSLVAHDPTVPSFRLRMAALRPHLEAGGLDVRVVALGRGQERLRMLRHAGTWRASDVLVFQQVKLLTGERAFVARLCGSWVLDVGDTAGRLAVLPTPVDLDTYPAAPLPDRGPVRLVWIGLASNLRYLEELVPVLLQLATAGVEFEPRVISDRLPNLRRVPCTLVPWSSTGESRALVDCNVGLAPLPDDAWRAQSRLPVHPVCGRRATHRGLRGAQLAARHARRIDRRE